MILFTTHNAIKVLERTKWQTRRFSLQRRWKPKSHHWAQLNMKPESRFAKLLIKRVWTWNGTSISDEDVKAEGYSSKWQFLNDYYKLNKGCMDTKRTHFAVEFEVVEEVHNPVIQELMGNNANDDDLIMFYCATCGKITQHYEPSPYDDVFYGEDRIYNDNTALFCAICE